MKLISLKHQQKMIRLQIEFFNYRRYRHTFWLYHLCDVDHHNKHREYHNKPARGPTERATFARLSPV